MSPVVLVLLPVLVLRLYYLHIDLRHSYSNMVLRIVPSSLCYAAIRIDPIAMVRDLGLDDPQTLAEARGVKNRTYLVLLHMVCRARVL